MPYITGLYSGVNVHAIPVDDADDVRALDELMNSLVDANLQDSVVSMVMYPSKFFESKTLPTVQVEKIGVPSTIDGYSPRNKKLLTYPYMFLTVDSLNDSHDYRYEWFDKDSNNAISFTMVGCATPNPEINLYPTGYNDGGEITYTEGLTMSGFPQVAFVIDSFRAWLAQHSTADMLHLFSQGVSTGGAMASGNLAAGVLGSVGMASTINSMLIDATKGSKVRGNIGTSIDVASRTKNFYFRFMGITKEYARMIDDFFDRYGYTCARIKVPNRNVRPHWTYTKTKDVAIRGRIPSDDLLKIKRIYNNGITFWKNGNEVGNYSLNNQV